MATSRCSSVHTASVLLTSVACRLGSADPQLWHLLWDLLCGVEADVPHEVRSSHMSCLSSSESACYCCITAALARQPPPRDDACMLAEGSMVNRASSQQQDEKGGFHHVCNELLWALGPVAALIEVGARPSQHMPC